MTLDMSDVDATISWARIFGSQNNITGNDPIASRMLFFSACSHDGTENCPGAGTFFYMMRRLFAGQSQDRPVVLCAQRAEFYKVMMDRIGFTNRQARIIACYPESVYPGTQDFRDHVLNEVYNAGRWQVMDSDNNMSAFLNSDGSYIGLMELVAATDYSTITATNNQGVSGWTGWPVYSWGGIAAQKDADFYACAHIKQGGAAEFVAGSQRANFDRLVTVNGVEMTLRAAVAATSNSLATVMLPRR